MLLSKPSTRYLAAAPRIMRLRMQSTAAPAGYKEDLSKGATYRFQDSLPHLPVPTLEETAKKYLRSVQPLLLPRAYAATEAAVKEFIRPGGQGEELQKRLQQVAAEKKNWLYDFWSEAAYMGYRDPVVPYVSYFYSYKDDPRFTTPAKRAAAIASATLKFKHMLDNKTLEPDYMRKAPIDMELFQYLFHNCRIPLPKVDGNNTWPVEGNEHILVLRRNRFYKVPYLTADKSRVLTTAELELQLEKVYNDAELKGTGVNIGALSSENRDVWVEFREDLLKASPENAEVLKQIESSAFVICLDFAHPQTKHERAMQYWHGNCRNRFYDKPVQLIVNDNNTAGFMGEHSMMDGMQTLRLNEFICDQLFKDKIELTTSLEYDGEPEELVFGINDKVLADVKQAEIDFWKQINQHEVEVWAFDGYGKGQIKQYKCSPDAYLQILLQLAYYRLYGCVRPVYEAATTRKFAQGRTETCRSVSTESADFCKAFWGNESTNKDKINKFRRATDSQVKYIADAAEGFGVDRHLFGLKKCLGENESLPAIYKDPAYGYSCSWYISSSQLSSEYFNGYGWSQVIDEGFGTAYMINENGLQVNICSKKLGSKQFGEALEEAAVKLAALLDTELNRAKL